MNAQLHIRSGQRLIVLPRGTMLTIQQGSRIYAVTETALFRLNERSNNFEFACDTNPDKPMLWRGYH